MEPVIYVMAILGCGDAGGLCSPARIDPARFTSLQACQAAAPAALTKHVDLDFPELSAKCRPTTAQDARQIAVRN